jgi:cation transport regulator
MPYTANNPPDQIKGLPSHAQAIWIAAFNSAWDEYNGDEGKCAATAWAAVKKSYKQDTDGNWTKLAASGDLETVDIPDVEILAVGNWNGHPKPIEITKDDLNEMVKSFKSLSDDEKLNYEPPVKLGHDEKQRLLQSDGYPAAGWVRSLKRAGDKLVATFGDVPKKVADLIKAGAYKKRSAEINSNYEIGGKTYKWVLKAVSLLGADIPAVKSIADIQALYGETQGETIVFYESLDKQLDTIRGAWYQAHPQPMNIPSPTESEPGWIREVLSDCVIIDRNGKTYRIPYTNADGAVNFQVDKSEEVESVWTPVKKANSELPREPGNNKLTEESSMDAVILTELGIKTEGEALEAIKALKKRAGETLTLAEGQALTAKVASLETQLTESNKKIAMKERDERISNALKAGKITPAQKPEWEAIALSEPERFDKIITAMPVVVDLKEHGKPGGEPQEVTLTEAEIKIAEKMGVTRESLIAAKKLEAK